MDKLLNEFVSKQKQQQQQQQQHQKQDAQIVEVVKTKQIKKEVPKNSLEGNNVSNEMAAVVIQFLETLKTKPDKVNL